MALASRVHRSSNRNRLSVSDETGARPVVSIEWAGLAMFAVAVIVAIGAFGQELTSVADEDGDGVRDGVIPGAYDQMIDAFDSLQGAGEEEAEPST